MIDLYLNLERIWFKFSQEIRFLLVGGVNTVLAYLLLNLLNFVLTLLLAGIFSNLLIANIALLVQYVLTINVSFITMRYYVFQSHGKWLQEWLKVWSVYLFFYLINAPILTFMLAILKWPIWLAQGVYIIFSTVSIFILHKYYSFRKN